MENIEHMYKVTKISFIYIYIYLDTSNIMHLKLLSMLKLGKNWNLLFRLE